MVLNDGAAHGAHPDAKAETMGGRKGGVGGWGGFASR